MTQSPPPSEIQGHPTLEFQNDWNPDGPPIVITVCAGCGQMRTVLWLSQDRWYCTQCKYLGINKPTLIPL